MGVNSGPAGLLLLEHSREAFTGSVLQLGRQKVTFDERRLRQWASQVSVPLAVSSNGNSSEVSVGELDDKRFFELIGFERVVSCDVSEYEGADLIVDLNQPVPTETHGQFDVVFNGGTLEHIYNVPRVMTNIHNMLKIGGRAIHIAPSSSLVDHGFYSFSPTFFSDYYEANDYTTCALYVFECFDWVSEWTIYQYDPGCFDDYWDKIATGKKVGVFCVAKKSASSTCDVVPTQGYYRRLWCRKTANQRKGVANNLKEYIKGNAPALAEFLYLLRSFSRQVPFRHRKFMPPMVGKF